MEEKESVYWYLILFIIYETVLLHNASIYYQDLLVLQHTRASFFLYTFRKVTYVLCVMSEVSHVFQCMYLFRPMEGYCHNTFCFVLHFEGYDKQCPFCFQCHQYLIVFVHTMHIYSIMDITRSFLWFVREGSGCTWDAWGQSSCWAISTVKKSVIVSAQTNLGILLCQVVYNASFFFLSLLCFMSLFSFIGLIRGHFHSPKK